MSSVKKINCITINTDASFNSQHNVGGYAFYIVCDLFRIKKGGIFKKNPKSPIDAEMMCMANALYTLLTQPELPSTKHIVINSDCLYSFSRITLKNKDLTGRAVARILKKLKEAMSANGVLPKSVFRHVKAHSGLDDKRSHVNEWCDMEAKQWMRSAVQKIKYKNKNDEN